MSRQRIGVAFAGSITGAVILLALAAPPASAHDVLVASSPANRSTVARTPAEVVLTFDQPAIALGTQVVVTGPAGPVSDGAPRLVDNTVTQPLTAGAPAGAYTVEWRVTSVDGHPVTGTLSFAAAAAGEARPEASSTPAPAAPATTSSGAPSWVWLLLAVTVLATGAGAFWSRRRRRSTVVRSQSGGN